MKKPKISRPPSAAKYVLKKGGILNREGILNRNWPDMSSSGNRDTMNLELCGTEKPPNTDVFPSFSSENH
mgnify:CR=1 FL=1